METYQQITFGIILAALTLRGFKIIHNEKESLWNLLSNIMFIIAITNLLWFIDINGLKTFAYWTGGLFLFYLVISSIIKYLEYQFEKEDEKIMDN